MKTTLFISGFIAAFCILFGMTMKILQWPGADYVLVVGDLSLVLSMGTFLLKSLRQPESEGTAARLGITMGASGGMMIGAGSFFKIMYWPTANLLFLLGMILVTFVFLPIFFWKLYKRAPAE